MEVKKELSEKDLRDYETARKAINGDRELYEKFFENHRKSIRSVLLRLLRDKSDVETLVPVVLEKSFSRLSEYPTQIFFSTWLFKITIEIATEFLNEK